MFRDALNFDFKISTNHKEYLLLYVFLREIVVF